MSTLVVSAKPCAAENHSNNTKCAFSSDASSLPPLPPLPKPWLDLGFSISLNRIFILYRCVLLLSCLSLFMGIEGTTSPELSALSILVRLGRAVAALVEILWLVTTLSPEFPLERNMHKCLYLIYSALGLIAWIVYNPTNGFALFYFFAKWMFMTSVASCPSPPCKPQSSNESFTMYCCPTALTWWSRTFFFATHVVPFLGLGTVVTLFLDLELAFVFIIVFGVALVSCQIGAILGCTRQAIGLQVRSDASILVELFDRTIVIHDVVNAYAGTPAKVDQVLTWARAQVKTHKYTELKKIVFPTTTDRNCVVVEYEGALCGKPGLSFRTLLFNDDNGVRRETLVSPENVEEFLLAIAHAKAYNESNDLCDTSDTTSLTDTDSIMEQEVHQDSKVDDNLSWIAENV